MSSYLLFNSAGNMPRNVFGEVTRVSGGRRSHSVRDDCALKLKLLVLQPSPCVMITLCVVMSPLATMPLLSRQVLGMNLTSSGLFAVLPWLTMAISSNVGGWIADTLISRGTSVTLVRKVSCCGPVRRARRCTCWAVRPRLIVALSPNLCWGSCRFFFVHVFHISVVVSGEAQFPYKCFSSEGFTAAGDA